MNSFIQFPRQALPDKRKTEKWRKQCVLWADSKSMLHSSPVRKSIRNKRINYDLLRGKIHMEDVAVLLNPADIEADYLPEKIQHFPIMNSKLEVLIGEELKRPFEWRAVVTNMNAVSEIENTKKQELLAAIQETIADSSLSEEEYAQKIEEISEYYTYEYQDFRELRANEYIKHYSKELNFPLMFNSGYRDALAVGEEIYLLDIVSGEPYMERINPEKIRVYRAGYSNKIEDADVIVIEDYWSPGRIIDTYYDSMSKRDIEYLENLPDYIFSGTGELGTVDERYGMLPKTMFDDDSFSAESPFDTTNFNVEPQLTPYDSAGNVRVMKVLWKSRRKIKKVSWYDDETGEKKFGFFTEGYVLREEKGEEEQVLWVNEAWEGTLIGGSNHNFEDHKHDGTYGIFVNIRPRPIQYNRLSNPSKCHLGVIGTIYNMNDDKPFSLVDMMKPYNYLYDVLHYRLVDALASSWGSLVDVDLAKIPSKWSFDKWLYFAKVNHLSVSNSMNEIQEGPAKGKLVGSLNNNTQRVINDASGTYIQQLMNLAEYVKSEMGEIVGITKQREGQVANRETVGGVERSVLQSSYITERYFAMHNDTKRRALEAFVETAKIAARGKKIKFRYIASDTSQKLMEFDGDEFAENDYGIVVDASSDVVNLDQKLDQLAQAALQNQMASLSDIMKMWTSTNSLAEKIRLMQNAENKRNQQAQQVQQAEMQQAQQAAQNQMMIEQAKLEQQAAMNTEDNDTRILVAQIQAESRMNNETEPDGIEAPMSQEAREKLKEQIREFNIKVQQENKKLDIMKEKNDISRIAAKKKPSNK